MQCYEQQAMYLKLYADAVVEIPQLTFDPDRLDDIISDHSISSLAELATLDHSRRDVIIAHIKPIIDGDNGHIEEAALLQSCTEAKQVSGKPYDRMFAQFG